MGKVVCAWELGGGLGHVSPLCAVGESLVARGHSVVYVLKKPDQLKCIFPQQSSEVVLAPLCKVRPKGLPESICNYAEILMRFGYLNPDSLASYYEQWRSILVQYQADLVIIDHAPTALLAAYTLGLKCILLGNGFGSPPDISPYPALRPDCTDVDRLITGQQQVLDTINAVLKRFKAGHFEKIADLFRHVEEDFLTTFAELDHYPHRKDANYWGLLHDESSGASPVWPNGAEKYVFAYLKTEHPDFKQVLSQLSSVDCNMLIYAGKVDDNIKKHYQSDGLYFSERILNMRNITEQSDLVVCHGGHNIVMLILLAGKPLLMLPLFLEQEMTSRRVEEYGAGLEASGQDAEKQPGKILRELLANETYKQKASDFAENYSAYDPKVILDKAALRCMEILS